MTRYLLYLYNVLAFWNMVLKMNLSVVEEVVHVEDAFHHGTSNLDEKKSNFQISIIFLSHINC
jgi:hypothetical protein